MLVWSCGSIWLVWRIYCLGDRKNREGTKPTITIMGHITFCYFLFFFAFWKEYLWKEYKGKNEYWTGCFNEYIRISGTIKSINVASFGVDYVSLSCWWPFRKYEKCLTLTSYLHSAGRKRIRPALIHIPTMETPKMHFSPSSISYSTDLISNVRLINPS